MRHSEKEQKRNSSCTYQFLLVIHIKIIKKLTFFRKWTYKIIMCECTYIYYTRTSLSLANIAP